MKIGFRWFIKDEWGVYEPHEKTFDTIDDCIKDVAEHYPKYVKTFKIDLVKDDEGVIEVLRHIF